MNSRVEFRIFTILDLDKEEEYLHEMHLKGWRYRTNRFGFFYFEQCQPDDVIYHIYDSRFFKKYKHELHDFRNRGWELIETGFCSILRKSYSDILPEDQVYMSKTHRWEVMQCRLHSSIATLLGALLLAWFYIEKIFLHHSSLFSVYTVS